MEIESFNKVVNALQSAQSKGAFTLEQAGKLYIHITNIKPYYDKLNAKIIDSTASMVTSSEEILSFKFLVFMLETAQAKGVFNLTEACEVAKRISILENRYTETQQTKNEIIEN